MKAFGFILLLTLLWLEKSLGLNRFSSELCKGNHGAYLQHFKDCRKFIRCSHNQAYEFQCPGNLIWHHKIKSCDFSYRVKCEINEMEQQEKEIGNEKTVYGSKFKREISKDNEKLITLPFKNVLTKTTALQKSLTDLQKPTKISTLKQNIPLNNLNLTNFSTQSTDFKTTTPCIKTNILTEIMLPELTTVKISENFVNLSTTSAELITEKLEISYDIYITEQTELSKTKDTSVTLSTEMLELITEQLKTNNVNLITEPTELSETKDTPFTLSTDMSESITDPLKTDTVTFTTGKTEISETTNPSVTLSTEMLKLITEKLKTFPDTFITKQTELSEIKHTPVTLSTDMSELITDHLEHDTVTFMTGKTEISKTTGPSVILPTDKLKLITEKLKDSIVNLITEPTELSKTTGPSELITEKLGTNTVNLITEPTKISETTDPSVTLSTEMLELITEKLETIPDNFITEQTEFSETKDTPFILSTEVLELITKKLETNNINLITGKTEFSEITEPPNQRKYELSEASEPSVTLSNEMLENLTENVVNLTEGLEFKETTDTFVKFTENLFNLTAEISNSITVTELPNVRPEVSTVNLTDEFLNITENSENLLIKLEKFSTASLNLVESSVNEISAISNNTTNKTSEEIVNLLKNSTDYKKINDYKVIISKESIFPEILVNLKENKIEKETDKMTELKENLKTSYNPLKTTTENSFKNETEILTQFPDLTTDLPSYPPSTATNLPITILSDNNLFSSTPSDLTFDSSTTLDPRLPFRSAVCQGANNRRQFKAFYCYQYYQCFAGWAFLLNCHDGWLFQASVGECVRDVNNECKV